MAISPPLSLPAKLSIAALFVLRLIGGALIVAYSGYETSPRYGGKSTYVPAPEAYILAALFFLMSGLAMLVLLRQRIGTVPALLRAVGGYVLMAWLLSLWLSPN